MNQQSKKIFSIFLAVLLSIGIIYLALNKNLFNATPHESANSVASNANTLQVVSSTQNNDTLQTAPISTVANDSSTLPDAPLGTTTTDLLARQLINNYAAFVQNTGTTTLSDADALSQAQVLANSIPVSYGKQYQVSDLNITEDNSRTAVINYTVAMTRLISNFVSSQTNGDLQVALEDPGTNSALRISKLEQNIAHYETLIKGILAVSTPSSLASIHLRVVQDYSDMQNGLKIMEGIFDDPVKGLTGFKQYQEAAQDTLVAQNEYKNYVLPN